MYDRILIPIDGSEGAEAARVNGTDLASIVGAEVHFLFVVETQASYILAVGEQLDEMAEWEAYGEEIVTDAADKAAE